MRFLASLLVNKEKGALYLFVLLSSFLFFFLKRKESSACFHFLFFIFYIFFKGVVLVCTFYLSHCFKKKECCTCLRC